MQGDTKKVRMAIILSSLVTTQGEGGEIETDDLRGALDDAGKRKFRATIYEMTKTHIDTRVYVTDREGIVLFDSN